MNDLDLSALASTPVPGLADASAVRARGAQRRRRGHALVASAAALVVAVGAGTAVAVADRGKPDALVPVAPTPTATEPAHEAATPFLRASARLLTPADATRAAGGTWGAGEVRDDAAPGLIVCPTATVSSSAGARRELHAEGGQVSAQVVVERDAEKWLVGAVQQDVRDCPRRAADSEDGKASDTFELVDVAPGASLAFPLAAVRDTYRDCDTCQEHVTLWLVVARGDFASYTSLPASERPRLLSWATAAHTRLGDPVADPPTPSPTPYVSPEPVILAPLDEGDLVEPDRIGPVEIGMTLAEAEAAAEQDLKQEGDALGDCLYYTPSTGEPDVSFMVIDGVVSRIDVDAGTTTTNTGIGIGSTEADVRKTHPSAVVSKHPYTDGHYLRVLSEDGQYAFLFETDGTKVTSFRSGYVSAVDQTEGCA
jgi:hypothetical protein